MRYLFLIIFIFLNFEVVNANFLNKKPEGLLFIEDENIRKENPFLIFFDYSKDNNQITRNSFMIHDTYLFADMFGALKRCNNRWGGLPSRNDIAKQIKDISIDEFKVFNSGYLASKFRGPLQCAPRGNNKKVFLEFVDEYLTALKFVSEDKEKYLASLDNSSNKKNDANVLVNSQNKEIKENQVNQNNNNDTISTDNISTSSKLVAQKDLKKNELKEVTENQLAQNEFLDLEKLENESQSMIADIKEFSKGNKSINAIELAQLFLKFNKSISSPWSKQTAKNYSELLAFMQTINGFNQYVLDKKTQREKELENRINEIVIVLSNYNNILQKFLIDNLGSEKTATVIELSEKITKLSQENNLNELSNLQEDVQEWMKENDLLEIDNLENNKVAETSDENGNNANIQKEVNQLANKLLENSETVQQENIVSTPKENFFNYTDDTIAKSENSLKSQVDTTKTVLPEKMGILYANFLKCKTVINPIVNSSYVENFSKKDFKKLEKLKEISLFAENFSKETAIVRDDQSDEFEKICGDAFSFAEGAIHGEIMVRDYTKIVSDSHDLTIPIIALTFANSNYCFEPMRELIGIDTIYNSAPKENYFTIMNFTHNYLTGSDEYVKLYVERAQENSNAQTELIDERCQTFIAYLTGFNHGIRSSSDIETELTKIKEEKLASEEKLAEEKRQYEALKIDGFNMEQSLWIHDTVVPQYTQYRNMKAICTEKGATPIKDEIIKFFDVTRMIIKEGHVEEFSQDTDWDKITDAAWQRSASPHKTWLEENGISVALFGSLTDNERIQKCKNEVLPGIIRMLRMFSKELEKLLNQEDPNKEKKSF